MNDSTRVGLREVLLVLGFIGVVTLISLKFSSGYIRIITDTKKLTGQHAPEIEFEMPNGKNSSLHKQKGEVLLINFWTSWCQKCMEEMPALKMLESHFSGKGLVILAFNIDETREKIKGKLQNGSFPKNLIFAFNKSYLRPYNVKTLPISLVLDQEGTVRQVYSGPQNWMDYKMIRMFNEMLK